MIRLRGFLRCLTAEQRFAVHAHMADHVARSQAEPGCIGFEITPTDDPMVFEVLESFRDRPAFDAHQARTRDSRWFAATRGILRDFRIEEIGD